MREFLVVTVKRIVAALLAAAIYEFVSRSIYSDSPPFAFLSEPLTRFATLSVAAFILLSVVIRYFRNRREQLISDNAPSAWLHKGRPNKVEEAVTTEKWGVKWEGIYGKNSRTSQPYIYVEGPFCPHDDTELTRRKVSRWIFFVRRVWICPKCDRQYARPIRHLYNEADEVGKIMKSAIENDRVIDNTK